jgi:hypothetical protein
MLASAVMLTRPPDLERIKQPAFRRCLKRSMTPMIELIRLLTLVPMAYGAWVHSVGYIALGVVALILASAAVWSGTGGLVRAPREVERGPFHVRSAAAPTGAKEDVSVAVTCVQILRADGVKQVKAGLGVNLRSGTRDAAGRRSGAQLPAA